MGIHLGAVAALGVRDTLPDVVPSGVASRVVRTALDASPALSAARPADQFKGMVEILSYH
jgi:hypothetical protein